MSFSDVHAWWAWVMVIGNGLAGAWALGAHWLPRLRARAMWWAAAAAQLTVAVQAVLGVLVLQVDGKEVEELHIVYGFVALAAVGIIYSYRPQIKQWEYLLYGLGGLFLMGMGIRGMILTPV